MCKSELPHDLVAKSLIEAVGFANTIIPILAKACDFVKEDLGRMPDGATRSPMAELQLAPALIRLRMHQLIDGYNKRREDVSKSHLKKRHIYNGAVCLVHQGTEFRVLKNSSRYPTRPSGINQIALIDQRKYREYSSSPNLFPELDPPLLNGLIYYGLKDFELYNAFVVIPDGFLNKHVVEVARQEVDVTSDLELVAAFANAGHLNILSAPSGVVLQDSIIVDASEYDPYEADESDSQELVELGEGIGDDADILPVEKIDEDI